MPVDQRLDQLRAVQLVIVVVVVHLEVVELQFLFCHLTEVLLIDSSMQMLAYVLAIVDLGCIVKQVLLSSSCRRSCSDGWRLLTRVWLSERRLRLLLLLVLLLLMVMLLLLRRLLVERRWWLVGVCEDSASGQEAEGKHQEE